MRDYLRAVGLLLLFLPLVLAGLLTYALIAAGLFTIAAGTLELLRNWDGSHTAMSRVFRGLDLLFIAPTAMLIIYALYMVAQATYDTMAPPRSVKTIDYHAAKRRLVDAKTFILGLLATAVAVRLVEDLLAGTPKSWHDTAVYAGAILVIGLYGASLDWLQSREK